MFEFSQETETVQREVYLAGAGKMGQGVKALALKSDDLSWIPRTHVVEGDNRLPSISTGCPLTSGMHYEECVCV